MDLLFSLLNKIIFQQVNKAISIDSVRDLPVTCFDTFLAATKKIVAEEETEIKFQLPLILQLSGGEIKKVFDEFIDNYPNAQNEPYQQALKDKIIQILASKNQDLQPPMPLEAIQQAVAKAWIGWPVLLFNKLSTKQGNFLILKDLASQNEQLQALLPDIKTTIADKNNKLVQLFQADLLQMHGNLARKLNRIAEDVTTANDKLDDAHDKLDDASLERDTLSEQMSEGFTALSQKIDGQPQPKPAYRDIFECISIQEVTAKHILDSRSEARQGFIDFYYHRDTQTRKHDQKILAALDNFKNVLVIGEPLSGKTRAIYEVIKTMQKPQERIRNYRHQAHKFKEYQHGYLLKPKAMQTFSKAVQLDFSSLTKGKNIPLVAFFDDLQFLFNNEELIAPTLSLFGQLFSHPNVVVVATCRSGSELHYLETQPILKAARFFEHFENGRAAIARINEARFPEKIAKVAKYAYDKHIRWFNKEKNQFDIQELKEKEEALAQALSRIKDITQQLFNRNIGSLFMPIKDMRERYWQYEEAEADEEALCFVILYALKCLYHWGKHSNTWFVREDVVSFCEQYEDKKIHRKTMRAALRRLSNDYFLTNYNDDFLKTEEVYLEEVIGVDRRNVKLSKKQMIKDLLAYTPENLLDYQHTIFNYFIKEEKDYHSIQQTYDHRFIQKQSDEYTTALILNKHTHEGFEALVRLFDQLQAKRLPCNNVAYHCLMEYAPRFEQTWHYFEQMQAANIASDAYTFTILLNRATQRKDIDKVIGLLEKTPIQLDEISYSTLINKSKTFEQALLFFQEMKDNNLLPNEISYNTLINKSKTFEQALRFFQEMKDNNLLLDEISYNTLINKSKTFEQALRFFQEMKDNNLLLDEISYSTLINKSPNFQQALQFFEEMKDNNLLPNEISYSTLINKSPNFQQALQFFEEMKDVGLEPNIYTYTILLKKTRNLDVLKKLCITMIKKNILPDAVDGHTYRAIKKIAQRKQNRDGYIAWMTVLEEIKSFIPKIWHDLLVKVENTLYKY